MNLPDECTCCGTKKPPIEFILLPGPFTTPIGGHLLTCGKCKAMYLPEDSEMDHYGKLDKIQLLLWGEVTDPHTQLEFGLVDESYGEEFSDAGSPAYFLPAYVLGDTPFPATHTYMLVVNPMLVGQMTIDLIRLLCSIITVNCFIAQRETQLLDLRIGTFKGDPLKVLKEPPSLSNWFTDLHRAIPYLALFLKESCLKDYVSQLSDALPIDYVENIWNQNYSTASSLIHTLPKKEQKKQVVIAHIYDCMDSYVKNSFSDTPNAMKNIRDSAILRMDTVMKDFLPPKR